MAYECRIYINSGFNATNIPDSAALLNTCEYVDTSALEILQERFLSNIKVRATWGQVKNADYVRLSDNTSAWYYAITGIGMLASDVAELSLIPDFITSIGLSGLSILDGITERVHTANDDYGAYESEDPLMTPAYPLRAASIWLKPDATNYLTYTFIESTLNPILTKSEGNATIFEDKQGGTGTACAVPNPVGNNHETQYTIAGRAAEYSPSTCLYGAIASNFNETYSDSIATLRSLGLEQAIIRQVTIPAGYVNAMFKTDSGYQYVSSVNGRDTDLKTAATQFNYVNTTAKNNKINYSEFTKYGIMSTTGDSMESTGADIYDKSVSSPVIRMITDPHLDGKPYFRFKTMNGDSSTEMFWRNCIPGMQWKEIPLLFQGASGSRLNEIKYQNQARMENLGLEYATAQNALKENQMLLNVGNATGNTATSLLSNLLGIDSKGNSTASATQGLASGYGLFGTITQNAYNAEALAVERGYTLGQFGINRMSELATLHINNKVVAPSFNIPYNSEVIRDFYGNSVLLYRYLYAEADVQRIDRLLTMYGYKHTKQLTSTDFFTRTNFNFVQANNITIGGHARWINEGMAEQIGAGVRVWHVKPNTSYYADNPIKGA